MAVENDDMSRLAWETALENMRGRVPVAAIEVLRRLLFNCDYLFEIQNFSDIYLFLPQNFITDVLERLGPMTVRWYLKRGVHIHPRMRAYAILDLLEAHSYHYMISLILRELNAYRDWSTGERMLLRSLALEVIHSVKRRSPRLAAKYVEVLIDKWVKIHGVSVYDARVVAVLAAKLTRFLKEHPLPVADAMDLGLAIKRARLSIHGLSERRKAELETEEEGEEEEEGSENTAEGDGEGAREPVGQAEGGIVASIESLRGLRRRAARLEREWRKRAESEQQQL